MLAFIFLAVIAFILYRLLGGAPVLRLRAQPQQNSADKITELTEYASKLRAGNKYTGAEKVYLQILKIDHRHTQTYSRLGTLYSAMNNQSDAIECFQIATQLSPSGHTFYNLGLAYYENRNYMKAIAAFEKAVMFEPSIQRYVGLAKSFNKIGDGERMIETLEQAAELEASPKVLWLLADAYEAAGRQEELPALYLKVKAIDPKDVRLKTIPKKVLKAAAEAQHA